MLRKQHRLVYTEPVVILIELKKPALPGFFILWRMHTGAAIMNKIDQLQQRLKQFAVDRDWEQFHAPKNLAMALIVEAAELVEHFQWLTEQQSKQLEADKLQQVAFELADIFIYSLRLAERLDIDLLDAVEKKIAINEQKYPVEKVKGSSKKYTEYT